MFNIKTKPITLFLDIPDCGNPTYEYDPNELVVTGQTHIDVNLSVRKHESKYKSSFFVSYCATSLHEGFFKALRVKENPQNNNEKATDISFQNDQFPLNARFVRFEANLPPRLLLNFGLIVRIDRGMGEEDFLCDPQIGNGPPKPGKTLTALELI